MEIDLELPPIRKERSYAALDTKNNDGGDEEIVIDHEIVGDGDGVNLNVLRDNRCRVESRVPRNGMEFETKEDAYSFYREYARSLGFGITIKASRRSKKSGKFIDIKIACSRFGNRRESSSTVSQRSCTKTDCKASIHIKKRFEGKWFVYSFLEEHNHEFFPDDFSNSISGRKNKACGKKGLQLVLDERDVELLLDYFMDMQAEAPGFKYVIDFDAEARMRNVFWIDKKGRHDYASFSDVIFFDTHYIRNKYRIPFVPIVGVNNHFQFVLFGCALIGDETKSSFTWLMRTWLRAVSSNSPKAVITDNNRSLVEATYDVFPNASHCFCPWHVFIEVGQHLSRKSKEPELLMMKFKKCTYRSWTGEEFDKSWNKMVKQFGLTDDEWMQSLYEDREKWSPAYMREVFLGGFCTAERSQSVVSFFDKYLRKETKFKEFIDQYKLFLHEGCQKEVKAEVETRSSEPKLISHSPFEKQMSKLYTNAAFKEFQTEVSGTHSCTLVKEGEDEQTIIYRVDDLERKQSFTVSLRKGTYDICCLCRLFEYSGFLCRHALLVLQLLGISAIPSNYILKRWTRAPKIVDITHQASANTDSRVQRLNDIYKLATKLGEEGSLSEEACKIANHALEEAMEHCERLDYCVKNILETTKTTAPCLSEVGHRKDKCSAKASEIKGPKKRKIRAEPETLSIGMEENSQDVLQLNQRSNRLHDSYISQQDFQVMGHFNSLSSLQDCYYSDQSLIQGVLGNFSGRASHQQNLHALLQGQFGFMPSSMEGCSQERDSLHNENCVSMMSKHLHD